MRTTTLLLLSLLLACSCRVVRIPDDEMAESFVEEGRWAQSLGNDGRALSAFQKALSWQPDHARAWAAILELAEGPLGTRIERWLAGAAPTQHVLVARGVLSRDPGYWSRAWELCAGDCAQLFALDRFRPESLADVRTHAGMLATLEPRSGMLDFLTAWSQLEVGELEGARSRLPILAAAQRRIVTAELALLEGRNEAALAELAEATGPEARRVRAAALIRLGRPRDALEIIATGPSSGELRVLSAAALARQGRREQALQVLDTQVLSTVYSPRLRVAGSRLLFDLLRDVEGRTMNSLLVSAMNWATLAQREALFTTAILGDGAREAIEIRLAMCEDPGATENQMEQWRQEIGFLRAMVARELSPRALWSVFRQSTPSNRLQAFRQLSPRHCSEAALVAIHSQDTELVILALKVLSERGLLESVEVPPTLASHDDARVRASWLSFVAAGGGARARKAIERGLQDPDTYVREVAQRLAREMDR